MKIKRTIATPLLVALIGLASGGWLLQQGVSPQQNVYFQARLLEEVVRHVSQRFVDPNEPGTLYQMAIDGMLEQLGDPHSVFMTPEDYEDLRVQTEGEYGGLGIEIDVRGGWLTVLSPLPNSPAERVGLQAGDRIISVEGETTKGWTTDDAVAALRGPRGSTVDIEIARVGFEDPIPFTVERDQIELTPIAAAFMLDDRVGYVELTVFSESATRDLKTAVDALRGQGMEALVLDMRRNTGGLLDQGILVSDMFLENRQLVLETRGRTPDQNQMFRARRGDEYAGMPVAVLIGQGSASATEIVAGALQDHDRAVLIGETSFGKGSVQTLYEMPGGNILKLTTARWYTPSGRSIQKPYGIGSEPMVAAAEATADEERAAADAAPSAEEKTEEGVPVYRTDSGREVLGGGGITPDLLVLDTLTDAEQRLGRELGDQVARFNNLLYRFAVEYAHDHPELDRGFSLGRDALTSFHELLRTEGVEVDPEVFFGASELVARRLVHEISVTKFGREEGRRRLMFTDARVAVALDLLASARTPSDVFARLPTYAETHGLSLGMQYQNGQERLPGTHP